MHAETHTNVHTHIHAHMHAYEQTYMHTLTHTNIHSSRQMNSQLDRRCRSQVRFCNLENYMDLISLVIMENNDRVNTRLEACLSQCSWNHVCLSYGIKNYQDTWTHCSMCMCRSLWRCRRPVCHSVLEIMCVWVMKLKIIKIPGHIVVCVCAEVCDGAWPYSWTWHQQWQWLQLWQWIFQDLDSDSQHFLQLALSVNVTVAGTVTILWQWLFHKTSTVTVSLWQWQWQCQCNSVLMPPESTSTQSLCPNTDL
jgi:hypothetical protein